MSDVSNFFKGTFECVMIFYLYFCTKSIEKKMTESEGAGMEGGRGRSRPRIRRRVGCSPTTLLFGSTLVFFSRRAEGRGCLAQSDLTQCLQYLPTCFLNGTVTPVSPASSTNSPTEDSPVPVGTVSSNTSTLKYTSARSQSHCFFLDRANTSVCFVFCCFFFLFCFLYVGILLDYCYGDKFYLNHWMEFHTHSTLPRLWRRGRCMKCFICYCANCIEKKNSI